MEKKPIVHLRVYRGGDLNYTADGKIKNENQSVKITHDTVEWSNFLRHLKSNQYGKVEVEKVLDPLKMNEKTELEPISDKDKLEAIKKEVSKAFNGPENEVVLTPEQKKIAELEAKLDALTNKGDKKEPNDVDDELSKAREEYVKVFGKKGHHSWSVEEINQKIKEKQQ